MSCVELLVGVAVGEQLRHPLEVGLAGAADELEAGRGEADEEAAGVVGAVDALDEPARSSPCTSRVMPERVSSTARASSTGRRRRPGASDSWTSTS